MTLCSPAHPSTMRTVLLAAFQGEKLRRNGLAGAKPTSCICIRVLRRQYGRLRSASARAPFHHLAARDRHISMAFCSRTHSTAISSHSKSMYRHPGCRQDFPACRCVCGGQVTRYPRRKWCGCTAAVRRRPLRPRRFCCRGRRRQASLWGICFSRQLPFLERLFVAGCSACTQEPRCPPSPAPGSCRYGSGRTRVQHWVSSSGSTRAGEAASKELDQLGPMHGSACSCSRLQAAAAVGAEELAARRARRGRAAAGRRRRRQSPLARPAAGRTSPSRRPTSARSRCARGRRGGRAGSWAAQTAGRGGPPLGGLPAGELAARASRSAPTWWRSGPALAGARLAGCCSSSCATTAARRSSWAGDLDALERADRQPRDAGATHHSPTRISAAITALVPTVTAAAAC